MAQSREETNRVRRAGWARNASRLNAQRRAERKVNGDQVRAERRAYYQAHKEKVLALNRRYREAHLEEKRALDREYNRANRERLAARNKERYEADKQTYFDRMKRWRKANPEAVATIIRNSTARRRGAGGKHSRGDVKELWERQGHKCAIPGCTHPITDRGEAKYHVDHVIPIKRGGTNAKENLQILCGPHNRSKHDHDPYQWAQKHGLLFL